MVSLPLPRTVAIILNEYQYLVEQHAPQLVAGLYLHGSIALGAFSEGFSDIDFIAVLSREAQDEDVRSLELVHRTVEKGHPQCGMDGSYLQWRDLGRPSDGIAPCPCYYDRRVHRSARHDINPVTWWILKHHGMAIIGPAPELLGFRVSWEQVIAYMVTNLNTYWAGWATSPRKLGRLLTDDGIQWAVLGICRPLVALQMGAMVPKLRAGEYALAQLPERWHGLIQEAVNLRSGSRPRHYGSRLARARDAAAFLKYVIAFCNSHVACPPRTA